MSAVEPTADKPTAIVPADVQEVQEVQGAQEVIVDVETIFTADEEVMRRLVAYARRLEAARKKKERRRNIVKCIKSFFNRG